MLPFQKSKKWSFLIKVHLPFNNSPALTYKHFWIARYLAIFQVYSRYGETLFSFKTDIVNSYLGSCFLLGNTFYIVNQMFFCRWKVLSWETFGWKSSSKEYLFVHLASINLSLSLIYVLFYMSFILSLFIYCYCFRFSWFSFYHNNINIQNWNSAKW